MPNPELGGADLKRRTFAAATAAAAAAAAGCAARLAPGYRFFTKDQARTIDAWTECLIPADDMPGASQAQVVRYIDLQLTRRFKKLQEPYQRASEAINAMASRAHAKSFADLPLDQQTALLQTIEKGQGYKSIWGNDGGKSAFDMVLNHTMQGFFGNPRHGGNRDYASWRLVGVPPLPVRGRLHYTFKENS
ncbi:MAG: gluconate 2-dehydrogenase subunit 3 family protein [Bryobacteraceae bacterium]|nr:gluconate 2-dehydrogenase subunit 3 family protein [Bryobacteraceae bacterium]